MCACLRVCVCIFMYDIHIFILSYDFLIPYRKLAQMGSEPQETNLFPTFLIASCSFLECANEIFACSNVICSVIPYWSMFP